jgi:small subunit ribosomal protein S17
MKKTVRKTKNYHAHDEANKAKVGDTVFIEESKPISKLKTWVLVDSVQGSEPSEGAGIVAKVKALVGL